MVNSESIPETGTLLAYTLGSVTCWHWVAVTAAAFPVLLIPGLLFLSDSPYWYLQQVRHLFLYFHLFCPFFYINYYSLVISLPGF